MMHWEEIGQLDEDSLSHRLHPFNTPCSQGHVVTFMEKLFALHGRLSKFSKLLLFKFVRPHLPNTLQFTSHSTIVTFKIKKTLGKMYSVRC